MSLCGVTAADAAAPARSLTATSTHWPSISVSAAARRCGRSPTPIAPTWALRALPPRVGVVEQRRAGHGEIAAPPGEFLEAQRRPDGPRRQPDLDDDLVGGERGGERRDEHVGGTDGALAGAPDNRDLGVAGHRDARHFRGRIGVRDAAADGAAIADLVVGDLADRGLEQGMRGVEPRVVLDVAPAHHGAEPHAGSR